MGGSRSNGNPRSLTELTETSFYFIQQVPSALRTIFSGDIDSPSVLHETDPSHSLKDNFGRSKRVLKSLASILNSKFIELLGESGFIAA